MADTWEKMNDKEKLEFLNRERKWHLDQFDLFRKGAKSLEETVDDLMKRVKALEKERR